MKAARAGFDGWDQAASNCLVPRLTETQPDSGGEQWWVALRGESALRHLHANYRKMFADAVD